MNSCEICFSSYDARSELGLIRWELFLHREIKDVLPTARADTLRVVYAGDPDPAMWAATVALLATTGTRDEACRIREIPMQSRFRGASADAALATLEAWFAGNRSVAIAVVGCPAGSGTNAIVRKCVPSALRESSVGAACHVMGAEDARDVRSSASSAGQGTLLDYAYSGHADVLAASHQ